MKTIISNIPIGIKQASEAYLNKFKEYVKQIGTRVLIFSLIALILNQKEFSFHFTIGNSNNK